MPTRAVQRRRIAPSPATASAVAALLVLDCERDAPHVLIPRPETQLVVRFGPSTPRGLDVHAFGARDRVHRKQIRAGQLTVTARLQLGASEVVLGVPASELTGRIITLEDLWGGVATRQLFDRLAHAPDPIAAAAIVDRAIAGRLAAAGWRQSGAQLARAAADRLATASVNAVASDLGISERHLRRVFRETVGVGPKAFAQLARFHRALRAARQERQPSWANIAVAAGYYDQAHLIAEFRAIAGVTPRTLLGELRETPAIPARDMQERPSKGGSHANTRPSDQTRTLCRSP
jgi:AraC-like DNA-binding protein